MEPTIVLAIALTLGAVGLLLRAVVKREPDPFIAKVIVLGLGVKVAGTFARYFLITDLYGFAGDSERYVLDGQAVASVIASGSLPVEATETGTPFMNFLVGLLFTVTPSTLLVGFATFSLLAFVGQYLFLQAFRLGVPDGDHRRYAVLIMFVPTMFFWPSSLGKEAWLVFTLGIGCYGAARVLRRARFGYAVALLGGAGMFAVRPHMGALFALSLAGAFVLRFRDADVRQRAAGWIVGLVVLGIGAGVAVSNFGELLPQDETIEGTQTEQIFTETARRTTQGGSGFDSRPVRTPIDFVHAAFTVPFRPFPTEASSLQAQVASLEGIALLGLFVAAAGRLRRLPREMLRRPYVALATAYSVGFIIAFSNVGNFGILTRQRAQLFPLFLVLLALPAVRERVSKRGPAPVLTPVTIEQQQELSEPPRPSEPAGT